MNTTPVDSRKAGCTCTITKHERMENRACPVHFPKPVDIRVTDDRLAELIRDRAKGCAMDQAEIDAGDLRANAWSVQCGLETLSVLREVQALRQSATASEKRVNELRFGEYVVSETEDPGKVDIFHGSGEGGRFDKVKLGLVIAGFYGENF